MLIFLLYAVSLLMLLKVLGFFQIDNFRGWGLYMALVVKLLLALLLYHFPYESMRDSQIYLHDSRVLSEVLFNSPRDFFTLFFNISPNENLELLHLIETNYWSHETAGLLSEKRNVIRINALFQILSFHNPYIVFLWNTLLSTLGLKLIYKAIRKTTSDSKNVLFVAVFLLPSTLLWSSNIMKESYLILGLGLFLYGILNVENRKQRIAFTVSGLLIMLMFKQYVAIGFSFGLAIFLLLQIKKYSYRIAALPLFFMLCALLFYTTHTKITERISQKQFDFMRLADGGIILSDLDNFYTLDSNSEDQLHFFTGKDKNRYATILYPTVATKENHGEEPKTVVLEPSKKHWYVIIQNDKSGSKIVLTPIQNESMQLFKNIPEALINASFRPFPSDPPKSIFKWYFVLENLLLWSIFCYAITKIKVNRNKNVIAMLLFSSLTIALLIGWTTPVIGAIVRYKMPIVLSLITVSWLLLFPHSTNTSKEKQ